MCDKGKGEKRKQFALDKKQIANNDNLFMFIANAYCQYSHMSEFSVCVVYICIYHCIINMISAEKQKLFTFSLSLSFVAPFKTLVSISPAFYGMVHVIITELCAEAFKIQTQKQKTMECFEAHTHTITHRNKITE